MGATYHLLLKLVINPMVLVRGELVLETARFRHQWYGNCMDINHIHIYPVRNDHVPPWEKEIHFQKGYVSSQDGNIQEEGIGGDHMLQTSY